MRDEQLLREVIESLMLVVDELREGNKQNKIEFEWHRSHSALATKHDLCEMEARIMSAISDWNAKVGPKLDRVQKGLDAVQALVEQLQNSPGSITPEDQALLDQIEAKVDSIANDADGVPAPPVA